MSKKKKKIPFCCGKIPCIKWKTPGSPCYELNKKDKDLLKIYNGKST